MNKIVWAEAVYDLTKNFQLIRGRNLLALVGIIIGTAAVIAMLHIGHNARQQAIDEFSRLGTDVIGIQLNSEGEENDSDWKVVVDFPNQISGIDAAAVVIMGSVDIRYNQLSLYAQQIAVTENYYSIASAKIMSGRRTYDIDKYSSYVVIGQNIYKKLYSTFSSHFSIGSMITVNGQAFTIIGILEEVPVNNVLMTNLNDSIIIPYLASRRTGGIFMTSVALRIRPGFDERVVASNVQNWFRENYKNKQVHILTARQVIESIDAQMTIYAYLLMGIGSISLIVSGVGIMNVMLISVVERRNEIGLRRAIGATKKSIIILFLSNSIILCLIGALIGVFLGTTVGWVFAMISGWHFTPSLMALPLGIILALCVSLFFGIYPSMKAANIEIVDALRSE